MKKIFLLFSLIFTILSVGIFAADKVIYVGTEGVYAPFTFVDEKGKLTGYDIEVMAEVAKRAGFKIKFVPTPWDSMFLGLESKKYDIIANQIGKNADREKKYIFSDSYLVSGAQIIVKDTNNKIKTLNDLKGKKVGTSVGSNYNKILTDFDKNKEINLVYYDGNVTEIFQEISLGRLDATVNDRLTVGENIKKLGLKVKVVGNPINKVPSYFVFRKDSGDLKNKVDKALLSMKKDGTLAKISKKWFNQDFTK
ncbi:MAG: transporter substrate-binding domain-containing protein [Fusobacteriaceae bacterium]|nr:transporter substrate-binding domain-containing protein [Fusobacteriaceae bacterium]MBN2838937.1 transporter substrate-binding domain-containing protein [Fusobacteriaceae bacterium]